MYTNKICFYIFQLFKKMFVRLKALKVLRFNLVAETTFFKQLYNL